jgi:hypothetical protein
MENIKEQLEEVIRKNLPEKKEITHPQFALWEKGFNQAISQINTSLIADEVLKVVVEKIKEKRDYWKNKPWNPEWNLEIKDKVEVLEDLLSNLSPNKENK